MAEINGGKFQENDVLKESIARGHELRVRSQDLEIKLQKLALLLKRNTLQFIFLKPIAALIGISYITVVVSALNSSEYQQYLVAWALAELWIVLSSFGLPATYTQLFPCKSQEFTSSRDGIYLMYPPYYVVLIRVIATLSVAPLMVGATLVYSDEFAFSFMGPIAFLAITEASCRDLETINEVRFKQWLTQTFMLARTALKLGIFVLFTSDEGLNISLESALTLEAIATGTVLVCSLMTSFFGVKSQSNRKFLGFYRDLLSVRRESLFPAYFSDLMWFLTGFEAVKLLIGLLGSAEDAESLGFTLTLAAYILRFSPPVLFFGIVKNYFLHISQLDTVGLSMIVQRLIVITCIFLYVAAAGFLGMNDLATRYLDVFPLTSDFHEILFLLKDYFYGAISVVALIAIRHIFFAILIAENNLILSLRSIKGSSSVFVMFLLFQLLLNLMPLSLALLLAIFFAECFWLLSVVFRLSGGSLRAVYGGELFCLFTFLILCWLLQFFNAFGISLIVTVLFGVSISIFTPRLFRTDHAR
ncbi:hypothetical protein N9334_00705 [Luminiphilus sp.]|nr:hypothetical protein [Luminiphilus sp.]